MMYKSKLNKCNFHQKRKKEINKNNKIKRILKETLTEKHKNKDKNKQENKIILD